MISSHQNGTVGRSEVEVNQGIICIRVADIEGEVSKIVGAFEFECDIGIEAAGVGDRVIGRCVGCAAGCVGVGVWIEEVE